MNFNITEEPPVGEVDGAGIESILATITESGVASRDITLSIESLSDVVIPNHVKNSMTTQKSRHGVQELLKYVRRQIGVKKIEATDIIFPMAQIIKKCQCLDIPTSIRLLEEDLAIVNKLYVPRSITETLPCDVVVNSVGDLHVGILTGVNTHSDQYVKVCSFTLGYLRSQHHEVVYGVTRLVCSLTSDTPIDSLGTLTVAYNGTVSEYITQHINCLKHIVKMELEKELLKLNNDIEDTKLGYPTQRRFNTELDTSILNVIIRKDEYFHNLLQR